MLLGIWKETNFTFTYQFKKIFSSSFTRTREESIGFTICHVFGILFFCTDFIVLDKALKCITDRCYKQPRHSVFRCTLSLKSLVKQLVNIEARITNN